VEGSVVSVKSDETTIRELAERHQLPVEAVQALFDALQRSGGSSVQFNHPGLGGMGQWSGGMLMIGDMFNDQLKGKVSAVLHELADEIGSRPAGSAKKPDTEVSYRSSPSSSGSHNWWPGDLGQPGSTGSQNHMKYAVFPSSKRLAIKDGDTVSIYDTADHNIHGVSQAQSGDATLSFTSQNGLVAVSELKKVHP